MATETTATPEVLWAQRSSVSDDGKNYIYLTISVPDVRQEELELDLQPTSIKFTGVSPMLKRTYHVQLDLYADIVPDKCVTHHTGKNIELKLQKKDAKQEYWPRLLKDPKKVHFLKTDFDKWVDEDEQNEAPEDDFSQFGGMGGGMPGMPGMGGMGGMGGDFGGIDFSKLGATGGMSDLSGGDDVDDVDSDEDEDMPGLEGEEAKAGEAADKKE